MSFTLLNSKDQLQFSDFSSIVQDGPMVSLFIILFVDSVPPLFQSIDSIILYISPIPYRRKGRH